MEHEELHPESWPPAITAALPSQPTLADNTARVGRRSVWLAASGIVCWIGAYAASILIDILSHGRIDSIPLLKTVYLLGIACEMTGIWRGAASRRTRVGKVGLTLSVITLTGMAAAAIYGHSVDENKEWFWTNMHYDCGCDSGP